MYIFNNFIKYMYISVYRYKMYIHITKTYIM